MASYIKNTLNIGKDSPDDVVETMSIEVDAVGTNLTSHGPWTFSPLLDPSVISSIDHGGLTGLGDDDHTQYVLADGTRQITGDQDIVGSLDVDNININGNTISSTDTNGNISLDPNGTGAVLAEANSFSVLKPGTGYRVAMNATADGYVTIRDDAAASKVVLRSNGNSYLDGGNVGIGPDTSPDYKLDVQGTLHADGAITGDSTLAVAGNTTLGNSSTDVISDQGIRQHYYDAANYTREYVFSGTCTSTPATHDITYPYTSGAVGGTLVLTTTSVDDTTVDVSSAESAVYKIILPAESVTNVGSLWESDAAGIQEVVVSGTTNGFHIEVDNDSAGGATINYTMHAKVIWAKQ